MGSLDALFADLLAHSDKKAAGTPGEIGDTGDTQAPAPPTVQPSTGDTLATNGDGQAAADAMSPSVATVSPQSNHPESEQPCGLSPMSPMSPIARVHALSPAQADRCHTPCWDDAEIEAFTTRVLLFVRRGMSPDDADDLAERLTLRDRKGDDRRMCIECSHLERSGRCAMARAGRLDGADRRLEPVQTVLQRCEGFAPVYAPSSRDCQ
jgi:hypothetical protein